MKIGIAGPINLNEIDKGLPKAQSTPLLVYFANRLIQEGQEVVIFALSSKVSKPIVIDWSKDMTIAIGRSTRHSGRKFFKEEIEDLKGLMKKTKPDIVHAHWSYEFGLAAIESGLPHVITIHDNATKVLQYYMDPFRAVRWLLNYKCLKKAQNLIANSEYIFNTIRPSYQDKALIINNAYPEALNNYTIDNEKEKCFVTISNSFDELKNVRTSLKAFSLIRKKYKDFRYRIIGSDMGSNGPAFQYAKKHHLDEGVDFLGSLPYSEALSMVNQSFAMIHPSREESFGMAVLEAMILGTPVIGGNSSGNIPYLLKNKKTGCVCDIEKPSEIAQSAIQLIEQQDLYHYIRKAGRDFGKKHFDEKKIFSKTISYYQSILHQEYKYNLVNSQITTS